MCRERTAKFGPTFIEPEAKEAGYASFGVLHGNLGRCYLPGLQDVLISGKKLLRLTKTNNVPNGRRRTITLYNCSMLAVYIK